MVETRARVRQQRRRDTGSRVPGEAARRTRHGVGRRSRVGPANVMQENEESGAVLIMSLAFLLVVATIVASLASWTTNNLNNTLQFQQTGSRLYAAEGATQVAIRASRYTYPPNNSDGTAYTSGTPYPCPGESPIANVNGVYVQVWCETVFPHSITATISREVTLTACQVPSSSGVGSACSGSAVLFDSRHLY